jgi:hypothetical protein
MIEREHDQPDDVSDIDATDVEEIVQELAEHPDAPEADVIEQHQSVVPTARPDIRLGSDVPEADALEQAIPLEGDDEFVEE